MRIGWDGRLVLTKTGKLKEFHRNLIRAYCDHYPNDEFLIYSDGKQSQPITEFIPQHIRSVSTIKPQGTIHKRLTEYWFNQVIGESFFRRKIDIYHSFDSRIPSVLPPGCKTKRIAGYYSAERYSKGPNSKFFSFLKIFSRTNSVASRLQKADLIFVPNTCLQNRLMDNYAIPKEKVRVLPTLLSSIFFEEKANVNQYEGQDPFYYLPGSFYLVLLNQNTTLESLQEFLSGYSRALRVQPSIEKLVIMRRSGISQEDIQLMAAALNIEKSLFFVPRLNATLRRMLFERTPLMFFIHQDAGVYHEVLEGLLSGTRCITTPGEAFEDLPAGSIQFYERNEDTWHTVFLNLAGKKADHLDSSFVKELRKLYNSESIASKLRAAYEQLLIK